MTTEHVVDAPEVLALMEKAVAERGEDWVYPAQGDCRYQYDPYDYDDETWAGPEEKAMVAYFGDVKAPACLVGKVLFDLNPEFLEQIVRNGDNGESVEALHLESGWVIGDETFLFTADAIHALQVGQSAQDTGVPWGESVDRAKKRIAGIA